MAFVPSLYHMLLQEPQFKSLDFSSCRICKSGAAPFPSELMKEVESVVGAGKIVEVYGLTETFILTMNPFKGKKKVGTVGVPIQSTLVKIVDLEGGMQEMPCGEDGEIIVRGPQIMTGYYKKPVETSSTFRKFQGETWFFTGDIGRMDADGYLTIVDRVKDMIIVGGYKVFSKEVEETLYDHPAVAFCAVVGVSNPAQPGGEQVKAIIQPIPEFMKIADHTLKEELIAHCKENLTAFKVPKIMDFVDNIPLTAVGKVNKKVLKSPDV
jgi:acyl-CoA synthetase (AMP-forming)/AMP-acid ligase II